MDQHPVQGKKIILTVLLGQLAPLWLHLTLIKRSLSSLIQWCITASLEHSFPYLATNLKPPPCSLATAIAFSHSSLHSSYLPCSKYTAEKTKVDHNKNREKATKNRKGHAFVFKCAFLLACVPGISFYLSEWPREWAAKPQGSFPQSNSLTAMLLIFAALLLLHSLNQTKNAGYISSTWTGVRVKQFSSVLSKVV